MTLYGPPKIGDLMRILLLSFIAALALTGCTKLQTEHAATGCTREARHEVTFSDPAHPDIVVARAEGPSCKQAIVTLTIRNANGEPLWAHAELYQRMVGGDTPLETEPTAEEIDRFLNSWADLTVAKTSALPEWPASAQTLAEAVQGMSYSTYFGRDAYEMLRARDLPEACFAISTEGSECIVMDPFAHTPVSIVRFGP